LAFDIHVGVDGDTASRSLPLLTLSRAEFESCFRNAPVDAVLLRKFISPNDDVVMRAEVAQALARATVARVLWQRLLAVCDVASDTGAGIFGFGD
jgi:hypothetical protein